MRQAHDFTPDEIMLNMGFPADATGPYVTALRLQVAKQVAQGMTNRSGGSWNTENHPDIWTQHEERARCILELGWEIEHNHTNCVELLDTAPIMRRTTLAYRDDGDRVIRRRIEFRPRLIAPWLRDRWRSLACDYRVWRDRNLKNPYR